MPSSQTAPRTSSRLGRRALSAGLDLLAGPAGVDGFLEQVRPTWSRNDPRAEVTAVRHETPDSVTLMLRPNRAWEGFRAGQYLQVAVKAHPEGLVSNFLIARARPGLVLSLEQAQGDFHLPDERPASVLLISAGSGITPVMSMLRTLCAERYGGQVTFLHFAPDPERAIYRAELEAIAAAHPNV